MAKNSTAVKAQKPAIEPTFELETPIPTEALPALHAIVVASNTKNGFLWMPEDQAKVFADAGFGEIHPTAKDGDAVAIVITQAGREYANANPALADEDYEAGEGDPIEVLKSEEKKVRRKTGYKPPENIEIDDGVPMPAMTRVGGTRAKIYPFDELGVGKSFHIPVTEENDNPAKSVASSVSAANLRYRPILMDEATGKPQMESKTYKHGGKTITKDVEKRGPAEREFTVRTVSKDDPKGPGCRVWRTK